MAVRRLRRAELQSATEPIVCVDLNGVLDRYTGWKHPGHWDPPREGAAGFLEALTAHGFLVVIFTTRHRTGVMRRLREHRQLEYVSAITSRKPPAHVFVDDRAVCFRGDFGATLKAVVEFAAHWERPASGAANASARARSVKARARRAKRSPSGDPASD
jgi:hypothetical protein